MTASAPLLSKNQSVVLETLQNASGPLSAYQIMDVPGVRERGLKAPLTIYRALDKLIERGMVHRLDSMNAFVACGRDEPHDSPAAFMICTACKSTIEVESTECVRSVHSIAEEISFDVERVQVEISGQCAACTEAET